MRFGSVEHYAVYLLLGIVLWTFFSEATSQGMASIVSRGDLLRKINFPKYIIVLSATISALINLALNLLIVGVLMVINGVTLHFTVLLVPLYIIEIYLLSLGIAFFLSALNVRYRDISHIWEIIIQAAFYATPVIYPLTLVIEKSAVAAKLLLMNPVAQAMQDIRYALVTRETITFSSLFGAKAYLIMIPLSIVALIFFFGANYFKHHSKYFAEQI
jgi:ABC-2 type transport system permease protein